MSSSDLHHLAAAYALDALEVDERRAFEAHFPTCEICRTEVVEFRETAAVMGNAAGEPPPAALKQAILEEVAQTRQLPPHVPDHVAQTNRRRARVGWSTVVAATAAALVGVVGTAISFRATGGADEVGSLLAAPDAVVSSFEGAEGSLRIVWSADRDEIAIVGMDLDHPGDSRTYALWFIDDAGVAPAALFEPGEDGTVRKVVAVADASPSQWAVTIEPAGGSPAPTSDILFSATI